METKTQSKHKTTAHASSSAHVAAPKACCGGQSPIVMIAAALAIGILVGALLASSMMGGQKAAVPAVNKTTVAKAASPAEIKALEGKVAKYIQDNLLKGQGVAISVSGSKVLANAEIYNMTFDIQQNGSSVGGGELFATSKYVILPQLVLDLDVPLPAQQPAAQPPAQPASVPKSDKPKVELFIMSFCPYGIQALGAMQQPAELLKGKIDSTIGYVIYDNYAKNRGADWSQYCSDASEKYCSMHGVTELNEDIRQMCIQKYQPDKLWAYLSQIVTDYNARAVSASNIADKWKGYAQTAGVDVAKVESCFNTEADALLAAQVVLNNQYGVQGSPSLIVNGADASFARNPEGFKTGICGAFNTAPSECSQTLSGGAAAAPAGGCG